MSKQDLPGEYDLVIRNGLVVDGSGAQPRKADVAVRLGRIAAIGKVDSSAREEVDADGLIVTPGFVDIHTHYDGQAIWSSRLNPSSSHGVTTVVAGNCGVGFAPCRPADHDMLILLMEGVEDIPGVVMAEGLPWDWETFPQFLQALETRQRDIDIALYLPHSPLRVYAMGERGAAREAATDADLDHMRELAREATMAGAIGFATSGLVIHKTADNQQIPSFNAAAREILAIATGMREGGGGMIQAVPHFPVLGEIRPELEALVDAARATGQPLTFTFGIGNGGSEEWRETLAEVDRIIASGVPVYPQIFPRPVGLIAGLDISANPFALCPTYRAMAGLPLAERVASLRQQEIADKVISEAPDEGHPLTQMARTWKWMFPMGDKANYEPARADSIARRAAARGVSPEREALDRLLEQEGHAKILVALGNFPNHSLDMVRELLTHPHTILGLGDGGAHYGMVCDASYPTFVLTHWVRDRSEARLTIGEAVYALSRKPAQAIGFHDRGLIAVGYKADINIIDLGKLMLHLPDVVDDLPAGGRRLDQRATGYVRTFVNGEAIVIDDCPTGKLPGRLVRGRQRPPADLH